MTPAPANRLALTAAMPRWTGDAGAWRDEVRRIEALGFDAVTISDHLTGGWVLEPVVAMTAALEATTTLRVESLVLGNDYRHPVLLAKAMATLDQLSGGRVGIGLGAGWMAGDYDATGIQLQPARVRVERLGEAVQVLRGLFADEPLTFAGRHYRIEGLDGLPKPVQPGGPPILVGGGGPRVLALAGTYADVAGVNPRLGTDRAIGAAVEDMTRAAVAERVGWVRAAAAAAGRDPAAVGIQLPVLALDLTDVPGARPWVSSMATSAPADLDSPCVVHGPVGACAEQVAADCERFGITSLQIGGDPVGAAALVAVLKTAWG